MEHWSNGESHEHKIFVNNLSDLKMSKISDLLGRDIEVTAANGTHIPFSGWAEVKLKLVGKSQNATELTVPNLSTEKKLEHPIIRYNIIEHFIHESENSQAESALNISDILCNSLYEKNESNVSTYMNFVNTRNENDPVSSVRRSKNKVTIPEGQFMKISCNVNTQGIYENTPAIFEPKLDIDTLLPGLEFRKELVTLSKGKSCRVGLTVSNNTNHNIRLS